MAQSGERERGGSEIDWIDANGLGPTRATSSEAAATPTPTPTPTPTTTSATTVSVGKRSGRWPVMLLSLAIVVALFRLVTATTGQPDELVEEPRPVAPSIAIVEADRTDRTPGTGAFERFPPFGFPELHIIVTDRNGEEPFRVSTVGSILAFDETSLAGRSDFLIDAGGGYLAAFSQPGHSDPDAGWVLWVGTVDGELEPLITGAGSFAWHDAEPGKMAFIAVAPGQDEPRLFTIGLADEQPSVTEVPNVVADLTGRLVLWGDWGFVIQGEGSSATVVEEGGRLVSDEVYGSVIGNLPSLGLIIVPFDSPREPVSIGVAPSNARDDREVVEVLVDPFEALADLLPIPDLVVGGVDGMVAVQAFGDRIDETVVMVLDEAGAEVARLPAGEDTTPVVWVDGGRQLAFIDEDRSDGISLVLYDVLDGDVRILPLGFLDPLQHRVQDLTLR